MTLFKRKSERVLSSLLYFYYVKSFRFRNMKQFFVFGWIDWFGGERISDNNDRIWADRFPRRSRGSLSIQVEGSWVLTYSDHLTKFASFSTRGYLERKPRNDVANTNRRNCKKKFYKNKTKHLRDYETRLADPRLEQKGVFGVLV